VDLAEVRVDVEVTAKCGPVVPAGNGEGGAASHDAVVNGVQDRDVITAEPKLGVG
jgi:hypothetical protein